MVAQHEERVRRLLEAALEKAPLERRSFLDGISQLNPSLRQEVESLLAAEEGPTVEKSTAIKPLSPVTKPADRIGPFHILREIGEGGMGVVYEAEQEKPVRRKVALKLIKWGMDTKAVVARFESERQALALMNHSNIASVFDAGATAEGRPYFAMEYVQGIPITEYCDKHRLTIKKRLELFIQVCEGVQHAHQKGIIHRDIKPSNVLVAVQDDKPVPKIIDFGVAKATSQRLTEHTIATELGQLIGTPEYMSPEQAEMSNLDIDTRTDVYSLGVLLYELLAGSQPFDPNVLRSAGLVEIQRRLREDEPPPPSSKAGSLGDASATVSANRQVDTRELPGVLKGDLDWITMKALEKDRTRRYGSPSDLAADTQRHLRNEPVLASPPSRVYRATKFIRRHRVGVATAGGFVLFLLGVVLLTVAQAEQISRERDRAETEAAKAQAMNVFMRETLLAPNPEAGVGREITVAEALGLAAEKLTESFAGQPEVEASARSAIGWAYFRLGRYDEAKPLLEEALDIRRRILGSEHLDLAESLERLARLKRRRAEYQESEALLREALSMRRSIQGAEHLDVASSLQAIAGLLSEEGRYDDAYEALEEAGAVLQGHGTESLGYANLQSQTAAVLWSQGKYKQAETLWQQVLATRRELLGNDNPLVASSLNNLAVLYDNTGRPNEAEQHYREALAIMQKTRGTEHEEVAVGMGNLAILLDRQGKYEEAEQLYREALRIDRKQLGDNNPGVASDLVNLASLLCARGKAAEGLSLTDEAIAIFLASLEQRDWRIGNTYQFRGRCLAGLGHYADAERELLKSLDLLSRALGADNWRVQAVQKRMVELYEAWGKPEKAAEYRALLEEAEAEAEEP